MALVESNIGLNLPRGWLQSTLRMANYPSLSIFRIASAERRPLTLPSTEPLPDMKRLVPLLALFVALSASIVAQEGKPLYTITATRGGMPLGEIRLELYPDIAPKHVRNFDSLVSIGFYNGTAFHRVIPGFMIQGGDPNSRDQPRDRWGFGDPSQTTVAAEFSKLSHQRGCLSAARTPDPNSATSQFFICVAAATHLDGLYTIFGRVIEGMNVVDTIVRSPRDNRDNPLEKIEMTIVRTGTDESIPAAPQLASPANDTMNVGTTQRLRWEAVEGAILYEVQVSATEDFSSLLYRDSVTGTTINVGNLAQGAVGHYWRIRASNGGRRGPFSEVRRFTTSGGASVRDGSSRDGHAANGIRFSARTSPASAARIDLWLPGRASVRLSIADVVGHEVARFATRTMEAGEHVIDLQGRIPGPAVYLLRLEIDRVVLTRKLMVGGQ